MSSKGREDVGDNVRRPITRKLVNPDGLLRVLNQRLESYGHCHTCRFVGPIRSLEDDADDGRNWSRSVPLVCSDGVGSGCRRIAQRILDDASNEYNLKTVA